ncbi:hypothetical protein H8S33_00395 [Ornithinibacillus sp. BX22]|uniref:CXXC-20-CXXC protein n=2 Tax=Ornithinibacillus TaxID=484508 RepID=A0A923RF60_9BACI|nr:hypothetical protein [Ornithinibacillus hominis]MBS3678840.1 hypothetical protein [Ornithinibacillus massiliensis]
MQKCEKCHTKFKWIEIYKFVWKSSFNKNNTMNCRKCGTEHMTSMESKIISIGFVFFIAFFGGYLVLTYFDTSSTLSILISFIVSLVLSTIAFTITPFLYRFYSKYHSNYKLLK